MSRLDELLMTTVNEVPPFAAFPKIPRLARPVIITEKIDGTNAAVWISPDGTVVQAGSRHRWIYPEKGKDNMGFARWVEDNREILVAKLGPGLHHGEWWGQGIQRGYGLQEKRFSLFNPRYEGAAQGARIEAGIALYTVPVLIEMNFFETDAVELTLLKLRDEGSSAAPGFMDPEGIVVYHTASGHLFKKTIKGDEKPKGSTE